MMSLIRSILGTLILILDRLFSPTPIQRSTENQARLEAELRKPQLYQFEACPFCVKVRRTMRRLNLPIELRDARKDTIYGQELAREGGMMQVPCLKITETGQKARWLYESSDIIEYLETFSRRFA